MEKPIQESVHFSTSSQADVRWFDSLADCARDTLPLLCNGMVGLSGGSTYAQLFKEWVTLAPDCRNARFFPVDERKVPLDDKDSNWGVAVRDFLTPLGRLTDRAHHARSASQYLELLRDRFSERVRFDTIFLGVGDDGHTASLFPGGDYLSDIQSVVLETVSPRPPRERITLGIRPLVDATQVVTVVSGSGKKQILREILDGDMRLPIVGVLSRRPQSIIYADRALR